MSVAGRFLSKALENPDEWEVTTHWIVHLPSKTQWWTSTGVWFFQGYDATPKCLTFFEKFWLYYKMNKMLQEKAALMFKRGLFNQEK